MTPDMALISSVAAKYGIPPAILYSVGKVESGYSDDVIAGTRVSSAGAIGAFQFMPATAEAYGVTPEELAGNFNLQLELAAMKLSKDFQAYGSWERTLSAYNSGNPDAYTSPTSSVGGYVYSVLGTAAQNPTMGMAPTPQGQMFTPANAQTWQATAADFQAVLEDFASSGGVVTHDSAAGFQSASQQAGTRAASAATTPGFATGGLSSAAVPFQLGALPFGKQYLGAGTETFGDTQGPGGYSERGNDYGLPHGTPVSSPVTGILQVVDYGSTNTGLTAYIQMPNGWRVYVGHLSSVSAQDGQLIQAGQALGASGGVPGVDSSPGNSTGAHVEVGILDPQGQYHDPRPLLTGPLGAQAQPTAPASGEPIPADVADFKSQLDSAGVTAANFIAQYPQLAAQQRRLLQSGMTVQDFARYSGMDPAVAIQAMRALPHPTYPEVTAGQYADMAGMASLHSVPTVGRTPHPAEVTRLIGANAGWKEAQQYYQQYTQQQQEAVDMPPTQDTSQKVTMGGPQ